MNKLKPLAAIGLLLTLVISSSYSLEDASKHTTNINSNTTEHADDVVVPEREAAKENYRLPKSLYPSYYKLQVVTHLDDDEKEFTFNGKVWIKLTCNETTNKVVLHSRNLTIPYTDIKLNEVIGNSVTENLIELNNPHLDEDNEFLIIPTKTKLEAGKEYELLIPFEGLLQEGLLGYYRSSYIDSKTKKTEWLSITQFEATYARRGFPCFDEPEFKAKFEIILGHKKSLTALSNMPATSTTPMEDHENWVWTHFDKSVPMSTYLVAYSINDFAYREAISDTKQKVKFRIWARRDALDQVDYALNIGPKVLKFFEEYFDVDFPLPKMDMIAIPDFSAGAMENWGLITYRETALLYKPHVSSIQSKHRVAEVVAHELAHQWFGNLVTMKWWTDLWLNEGFATYVESLGVRHLHPEWNSYIDEAIDSIGYVFNLDSLKSSHPVSVKIGNPSEISQIFDAISYQKGSTIIRMMHQFLGEEAFRMGVNKYLKNHKYGNAEQDDLWDSLTKEAHALGTLDKSLTVKDIMDTWTLQTGYPELTVNRDYDGKSVHITQKRYLADQSDKNRMAPECWSIPLSYTTRDAHDFNDTMPKTWMHCDHDTYEKKIENVATTEDWIIFNLQLSALYKVNYDEKNWDLLIAHLNSPKFEQIDFVNRAQLIDDAFDFATINELNYTTPLKLISYLNYEDRYIPWRTALGNIGRLNNLLKRTSDYGHFKKYLKKIISSIYKKLNGLTMNEDDKFDMIKHKVLISGWACRLGISDCIETSKNLFNKWMSEEKPDEKNPISADIKSIVYCNAIRKGDEVEWDFLWERYLKSNVGAEKVLILSALGCTNELWILKRYLEWSIDSTSGIRKQDLSIVFSAVGHNDIGTYLAKQFFYQNIDRIYDYYRPDTSRIGRLFRSITESIMTDYERNEFKEFVERNKKLFEDASQSLNQALEKININIQWHEKFYKSVVNYFKDI